MFLADFTSVGLLLFVVSGAVLADEKLACSALILLVEDEEEARETPDAAVFVEGAALFSQNGSFDIFFV